MFIFEFLIPDQAVKYIQNTFALGIVKFSMSFLFHVNFFLYNIFCSQCIITASPPNCALEDEGNQMFQSRFSLESH